MLRWVCSQQAHIEIAVLAMRISLFCQFNAQLKYVSFLQLIREDHSRLASSSLLGVPGVLRSISLSEAPTCQTGDHQPVPVVEMSLLQRTRLWFASRLQFSSIAGLHRCSIDFSECRPEMQSGKELSNSDIPRAR